MSSVEVHIVSITTEDGEVYKYAFHQKPSETKIKSMFFRDHKENYNRKDWGVCIGFDIEKLEVHT